MLNDKMSVQVEWGDCDPARIVFYPRYFAWVDAAAHHMLANGGLHQDDLCERYNMRGLVLGKVGMEFKTPAHFGEIIEITSSVSRIGGASFDITHEVYRGDTLILTGEETRIWALENPSKPAGIAAGPIPEEVRAKLEGD